MEVAEQDEMDYENLKFFPDWAVIQTGPNETFTFPIDMKFNEGHVISIIVYSILMVVSAVGNVTVLILLVRRRRKILSRVNTMLMHLAIADLLVTFILMPIEIIWAMTVSWWAGDAACRITAFFRTFGLYLSSFVLICISVDRYLAILKPMKIYCIDRRVKTMLAMAWLGSFLCSLPQMVVFRVQSHPKVTWYKQCITLNSFPSQAHELTYSFFGMIMMYAFPLIVIIYSYASILVEICRKTQEENQDIRRSSIGFLGKAKTRTLKMTITIVAAFFVCWTPYYVMAIWYWLDRDSARLVDQRIQKGLFLFACTNSSVNPIVYGIFNIRHKNDDKGRVRRSTNTCTTEIKLPTITNPLSIDKSGQLKS